MSLLEERVNGWKSILNLAGLGWNWNNGVEIGINWVKLESGWNFYL